MLNTENLYKEGKSDANNAINYIDEIVGNDTNYSLLQKSRRRTQHLHNDARPIKKSIRLGPQRTNARKHCPQ